MTYKDLESLAKEINRDLELCSIGCPNPEGLGYVQRLHVILNTLNKVLGSTPKDPAKSVEL